MIYRSTGRVLLAAGIALMLPAAGAWAQSPQPPASQMSGAAAASELRDELARLRQEFDTMRADYQKRMADLEARLTAVESRPAGGASQEVAPARDPENVVAPVTAPTTPSPTAPEQPGAAPPAPQEPAPTPAPTAPGQPAPTEQPSGAQPTAQVPTGAAGAGGPEGALPVYGNVSALSKIFNPDMAVIGNFIGAAGENEIDNRPALSMDEAEFSFQAVVDPYARADFFVAAGTEEIELEEGYITLTSLPGGVLAKVGKMKAQFGKTNTLHPHQLPWVDQPLVLQNIVGSEEGLNDSGVSVSKLLLNPWIFLEATGEIYTGDNATFRTYKRSDVTWLGRVRGYRDLTEGTNLDLGTSFAFGRNELGEESRTSLFGIDATFRYRPLRRATSRRLLARAEFMWNRASSQLDDGSDDVRTAFGMYAGGEYQFARRWFAGARYDYAERALDPLLSDKGASFLLTFWPSEFSQVRGQFRRVKYAEGTTGNEVLFQFLFSIGAHGAHIF